LSDYALWRNVNGLGCIKTGHERQHTGGRTGIRAKGATERPSALLKEDHARFTLVRVQAHRLETQLTVMAADSRAGRAELPLTISPAMLIAGALEKALDATALELRRADKK
jgi:hypothetical protein